MDIYTNRKYREITWLTIQLYNNKSHSHTSSWLDKYIYVESCILTFIYYFFFLKKKLPWYALMRQEYDKEDNVTQTKCQFVKLWVYF